MKTKILFTLLAACILATGALVFLLPPAATRWICLPAAIALVDMLLLMQNVIGPSLVAQRGIELISAQDLNTRLVKVGERDADKIVTLFNSLIDKLRNQRIQNQEQNGFLRLLIEASPMGVMILDFEGRVKLINRSMLRITGIAHEDEALGCGMQALPTDFASKMARVPLGTNAIIRSGGVNRYRCYHLSFVQTGFQRQFYLLEDLTDEVMKAEREAYGKLIRVILHEVNNTMGGVKAVLGMLHDSADDGEVREVIESCDDRCAMLCSFIRSYADLVKLPEPDKRQVSLSSELSAMVPFIQQMVGSRISVSLDTGTDPLQVSIDLSMIQQVVVNIVKNAAESIAGAGHIGITAGRDRHRVWMEIANDGEPISEEVAQKLFSPFFTTKREGRGLGLALISEILNRHKARFSLATDADGITRFRIVFP